MAVDRFLAEHPGAFALSLAGAGLALAAFAGRAARRHGLARLGWAVLALGQGAQVAGLLRARRRGRLDALPAWS